MSVQQRRWALSFATLAFLLILVPILRVSVPDDRANDRSALVVLGVKNHTGITVKNIHFKFKTASSVTVVTLTSVPPQTSLISFPAIPSGEFAVEAMSDLFDSSCTDYWPGWPDGFQLEIVRVEGAFHAKCTNKQWVDRYSAVDLIRGWRPQIERNFRAVVERNYSN